jgi:hypothetical protein
MLPSRLQQAGFGDAMHASLFFVRHVGKLIADY